MVIELPKISGCPKDFIQKDAKIWTIAIATYPCAVLIGTNYSYDEEYV
ncbi:hypothetical protein [Nostoc sp.]